MNEHDRTAMVSIAGSRMLDCHALGGDVRCDMLANDDCDVITTISALVTPGDEDLQFALAVESEEEGKEGGVESVKYFRMNNRRSLLTLKRLIEIALDK